MSSTSVGLADFGPNTSTIIPSSTSHNMTTTPFNMDDAEMARLQIVMEALLITLTILLMLSFGCSLEITSIRQHLAKPTNVVLAMLLQFIVLPYCYYAVEEVLELSIYNKVALAVLATCPSGGIANMFVYYAGGDLALGIVIAAASNVLALGFMPLNLWLFSRTWSEQFVLPYTEIIIALVTILLPVATGMYILRRSARVATWIYNIGSVVASLMIVATIAMSSYTYPQMYSAPWQVWLLTAIFAPANFLIGYVIALAMRMPAAIARTIAITTGVKSMALCLTILAVSFPANEYLKYLAFPELHSVVVIAEMSLYSALCKLHQRWNGETHSISNGEPVINHALSEGSICALATADVLNVRDGNVAPVTMVNGKRPAIRRMSASSLYTLPATGNDRNV